MLFEEKEDITVSLHTNFIIYFLLDKKEVVYVGQSVRNLIRPFQHLRDKKFDEIKAIYLEEDKELLNKTESYYISKYKPKYNISLNTDFEKTKKQLEKYEKKMDQLFLQSEEQNEELITGNFFSIRELNYLLKIGINT